MKKIFLLIFTILCMGFTYAQDTGNLTVHITDLVGTSGVVRFALFNDRGAYQDSSSNGSGAYYTTVIKKINRDGTANLVIRDIPYGEYAFKLYHDRDNSGTLTTKWYGAPKEEVGFSNSADASSGAPRYYLVKFIFDEDHKVQNVKMQSFD